MKTNHISEYKTPQVETLSLHESGVLCSSITGTATTDKFVFDNELSVEDYF